MSDKRCFCIDTKTEDIETVIKQLRMANGVAPAPVPIMVSGSMLPGVELLAPIVEDTDQRGTITSDQRGTIRDEDDKVLSLINNLMSAKIEHLNDVVRPSNEPIVDKDSMTEQRPSNRASDDTIDLNKMASTATPNLRSVDNMGIFEDFNCDSKCSNIKQSTSLFDTIEAKSLLFTLALLFLCSIIFRK